jgi:hypothetical protein
VNGCKTRNGTKQRQHEILLFAILLFVCQCEIETNLKQRGDEMSKHWKTGDIIRVPAYGGGYRVWRVSAVLLGGTSQESVIELETLDRIASEEGRLLVPIEILESTEFIG